mmetsp:Transcript_74920/g.178193  ORF Transcript_74920/g.178193 Transcript_74920/m.178193 type:complete len:446 (+) Transcript_74920:85-1422(+)
MARNRSSRSRSDGSDRRNRRRKEDRKARDQDGKSRRREGRRKEKKDKKQKDKKAKKDKEASQRGESERLAEKLKVTAAKQELPAAEQAPKETTQEAASSSSTSSSSDDEQDGIAGAAAPSVISIPQPEAGESAGAGLGFRFSDVADVICGVHDLRGGKKTSRKRKAEKDDESDVASTASSSSSSSSKKSSRSGAAANSEDVAEVQVVQSTAGVELEAPLSKRQRLAKEMCRRVRNTTAGQCRYLALAVIADKIFESGKKSKNCPWTKAELQDVVRELMAKELEVAKEYAARGEEPSPPTPDPKCPPKMDDEVANGKYRPMHRWIKPVKGSALKKKPSPNQPAQPSTPRWQSNIRWATDSGEELSAWVEEDELVSKKVQEQRIQISDWRCNFHELWWFRPGSEVICDRCGEHFMQSEGKLAGVLDGSAFAQNEFFCFTCLPPQFAG